jgi:hypothetical protein
MGSKLTHQEWRAREKTAVADDWAKKAIGVAAIWVSRSVYSFKTMNRWRIIVNPSRRDRQAWPQSER